MNATVSLIILVLYLCLILLFHLCKMLLKCTWIFVITPAQDAILAEGHLHQAESAADA